MELKRLTETNIRAFRVKMADKMSQDLDNLVKEGDFITYADAIRSAIKMLLDERSQ